MDMTPTAQLLIPTAASTTVIGNNTACPTLTETPQASFAKTQQSYPESAEEWYQRSKALTQDKRYQAALESVEISLQLCPQNSQALNLRASLLIYLKRPTEALNCCQQALAIDTSNPTTWVLQGAAFHQLGYYKRAYQSYEQALGLKKPIQRKPLKRSLQYWMQTVFTRFYTDAA